jgi:hypothetical protein
VVFFSDVRAHVVQVNHLGGRRACFLLILVCCGGILVYGPFYAHAVDLHGLLHYSRFYITTIPSFTVTLHCVPAPDTAFTLLVGLLGVAPGVSPCSCLSCILTFAVSRIQTLADGLLYYDALLRLGSLRCMRFDSCCTWRYILFHFCWTRTLGRLVYS